MNQGIGYELGSDSFQQQCSFESPASFSLLPFQIPRPFCAALFYGRTHSYKRLMAMMTLSFWMMLLPRSVSFTCPSSCSTISPLPYPYGAVPGCGSPDFQLDCSFSPPQWNITTGGYTGSYYIINISSNPNYSNPQSGSYGDGGTVIVDVRPTTNSTCEVLGASTSAMNDFISSDLNALDDAVFIYYQDSYLFFNCSPPTGTHQAPTTGVLINSSSTCSKFLDYCGFSNNTSCLEYIPYQQLQLSPFNSIYKCSTRTRFVIPPGNASVSTWKPYTQFAWGPVKNADSCNACQKTGGTCGYDTQDKSFLCFCGDKTYQDVCSTGTAKAVAIGISLSVVLMVFLGGVGFQYRHKLGVFASQKHLKFDGINEAALEIPYLFLAAVTKSFSTQIGQGAFGRVYVGQLYDGNEVAVKVLDCSVSHTDQQVLNEVATIGNIHHVNIARLVGYCFNRSRRILVYEYVSHGSLDKYLFSKQTDAGMQVLNWQQRFEIALGVARGLAYMHEVCRKCIIHCDIKPQNILLDAAYCPKISDFGLARLLKREESKVMTQARGTPGYVAPEFWLGTGPLSAKCDVYSYGMVLLEIIRGRRNFDEFDPFTHEEAELNTFESVCIDERIRQDADLEQAQICTLVALWCIQYDSSMRPTMGRVVQFLQGTVAVPDNPPRPFRPAVFQDESPSAILLKALNTSLSSFS